jgi:hypothetical protein
MATKKKAETVTETAPEKAKKYTLAEAKAVLREEKAAAKEARKGRTGKRGFHADPVEDTDMAYNVLAKGQFSNGEGRLVEIRAVMADGDRVRVAAYPCGPWVKGVSVVGDTVEGAASALADMLSELAEALTDDATRTVSTLSRDYVKAAKGHDYVPPKRK